MGPMGTYFINGLAGKKLKKEFLAQLFSAGEPDCSGELPLEQRFYSPKGIRKNYTEYDTAPTVKMEGPTIISSSIVETDPTRDYHGNPITENHPYYELSQAMTQFREGITIELPIRTRNLEKFLLEQGKHFTAGFLSRFGQFHQRRLTTQTFWLEKLKYMKEYRVAKMVYGKL